MTRLRVATGRAAASIRGAARVWFLALGIAAAAAAVFAGPVSRLQPLETPVRIPWWVIAGLFYLAEIHVVHLQVRREAYSFSMSEIPLVLGLYFASPRALMLACLAGPFLALVVNRRQSALKTIFNLSHFALQAGIAVVVFHRWIGRANPIGAMGLAATFAATLVAILVSVLAIGLAIVLSEGAPKVRTIVQGLTIGVTVTVSNTCLALIATTMVWHEWRAAWLMLVPTAMLFLAYRAYTTQRQKHESLRFLYEATRTMLESRQIEPAILALLGQAREMFRAERAEVILFPQSEGETALRTSLGPGDDVEVMKPVELDRREGLWARVLFGGKALLVPRAARGAGAETPGLPAGVRDAMAAPLRGETRVIGTMLVEDRLGEIGTFDENDLTLFETLANHASVSLENGRLEQSLARLTELKDQLRHQALHDPLTSLANRTLLADRLDQAIAAARRSGEPVALLLMDLDRFKEINDSFGHVEGDAVLQQIGPRLASVLRESDTIARYGGDEFAVVLPRTGEEGALLAARKVIAAIRRPFEVDGATVDVGVSIGIALFPEHGAGCASLMQRADIAMYVAKHARSGVAVFRSEVDPRDGMGAGADLRHAIDAGQLVLHYQPTIDLRTGTVSGVEALVRWQHPERGLLPPDDFVPIAEENGVARSLTMWVLDNALRQCRDWQEAGIDLNVSVNLPSQVLVVEGFPDAVAVLLAAWRLEPSVLTFEITESAVMPDCPATAQALDRLDAIGVRISIDDFGTGYSSLARLKQLPVHEIKIDKSFVMDIAGDESDVVISRSTIGLGHDLGISVVAEGVETREALRVLMDLGCDVVQGFYLGRPMTPDSFEAWMRDGVATRRREIDLARVGVAGPHNLRRSASAS